jgi:hypothetical protein
MSWKTRIHEILFALVPPLVLVGAIWIAQPVGEFPITDDFDYAATSFDWLRTGELRLSDWPSMTLATHAAWGAVFCAFMGNSFWSLRVSTWSLCGLGMLALFAWLRFHGASRATAILATITVFFGPSTFLYSCSFMTDMPAVVWSIFTLLTILWADRNPHPMRFGCAGIVAALGYLGRQTAAIPALAGILVLILRGKRTHALMLGLPLVAAAIGFSVWQSQQGRPYHSQIAMINWSQLGDLSQLFHRTQRIVAAVALYAFPVIFCLGGASVSRQQWRLRIIISLAAFLASYVPMLRSEHNDVANVTTVGHADQGTFGGTHFRGFDNAELFDCGVGADWTVHRSDALAGIRWVWGQRVIRLFEVLVSAAMAISMGWLLAAAPRIVSNARHHSTLAIPWISLLGFSGFVLVAGSSYERYMLPIWCLLIPTVVAADQQQSSRNPPWVAWLAVFVVLAGSVIGMQDFFARQRVFWDAAESLLKQGKRIDQIDAGMEFAGVHYFNRMFRHTEKRVKPFLASLSEEERQQFICPLEPSPYTPYRLRREFSVGYEAGDHERILYRVPYRTWFRTGEILVMQRDLRTLKSQ